MSSPGRTVTGAFPGPVSVTVCGLPVALSTTLSVAVLVPDAMGVKVTFSWQVFPAGRVLGAVGQELVIEKSLGSAPVMFTEAMVSATFCSLVSVTVLGRLVSPTNVVGNDSEVGESTTGVIAVAVRLTICGLLAALSTTLNEAAACAPRVVAVRSTPITQLFPAAKAVVVEQVVCVASRL